MKPRTLTVSVVLLAALTSCQAHRLEQVYYLGSFDPTEQLPPSLYRIRVKGTASAISTVNYAAGWVPAQFIDSLSTKAAFDRETGDLEFRTSEGIDKVNLQTGRRLMMFGPEGFREAPRDHRLVIIMDSDPSAFFEAIDTALGQFSAAKQLGAQTVEAGNEKILHRLLEVIEQERRLRAQRESLTVDAREAGR